MNKPHIKPDKMGLYLEYLHVYKDIQHNPRARKAMRNDPGVRFMRRMGWVMWLIFGLLAAFGAHL